MMSDLIPQDITPAYPVQIPDEAVRVRLLELLGLESIPESVNVTMDSEEKTAEGMTLIRLHFTNVLGETVPGILLIPSGADTRPRPGVVCLPGTSGDAGRLTHKRFYRQSPTEGPLFGWGRELARRGFATLSITVKGTEKRKKDIENWEHEAKLLVPYGRTQMGVVVDETLRAAQILIKSEAVDPVRIGLSGMSLGGNATWYAMACAPWIRTAVAVCGGIGSMARVIHEADDPNRHGSYFYVPHMLRFFDHPRIVRACIAPRPFMAIAPTRDEDMPSTGVDELIQQVNPVYVSAGVPERFKVYRPEINHVFLMEFFEWMVKWFNTYLTR
jgi:dienelactone hydrolase